MAHGRICIVLGVQESCTGIVQFCDNVKRGRGQAASLAAPVAPAKNRLSDADIFSLLTKNAQLCKELAREEIGVVFSILGSQARLNEIGTVMDFFGIGLEEGECATLENIGQSDIDALIYLPLDVQPGRQVEQLARLSLICPRVRHITLAAAPRWSHAQLMALRETWEWVDPRSQGRLQALSDELIGNLGGLTNKDLAKVSAINPAALSNDRGPEGAGDTLNPVIITRSPKLREVLGLVDAVADSDSTILITGDSGVGKDLIAQRIHAKSHRGRAPFNVVNCGAIPSELLESELFGHVKGAFTGAVSNREGRFAAANRGTLFLDEIGEMGANLQVKLLRVIQSKKYEQVGSTKSLHADVRIVAATNRDLELEVREGRFREDLFYRLNVIPVHVPALRERKEDVELLVDFFIKKFNKEKNRRVTGVTRASLRAMVAYDWPGNVRELENLMERLVILKSSGMIDVLDFPEKYRRQTLSEIEYDDLINAAKRVTHTPAAMPAPMPLAAPAVAEISVQETISMDDEMDKGGVMKISGTFTRGPIEQSAPATNVVEAAPQTNVASQNASFEGGITVEQALRMLTEKLIFPVEGLDFNAVVDQFENILILQALDRTGWNRNRAAGLLRLNRTTLVEKLKKKQLVPPMQVSGQPIHGNV